jgi:hypothetical protein
MYPVSEVSSGQDGGTRALVLRKLFGVVRPFHLQAYTFESERSSARSIEALRTILSGDAARRHR